MKHLINLLLLLYVRHVLLGDACPFVCNVLLCANDFSLDVSFNSPSVESSLIPFDVSDTKCMCNFFFLFNILISRYAEHLANYISATDCIVQIIQFRMPRQNIHNCFHIEWITQKQISRHLWWLSGIYYLGICETMATICSGSKQTGKYISLIFINIGPTTHTAYAYCMYSIQFLSHWYHVWLWKVVCCVWAMYWICDLPMLAKCMYIHATRTSSAHCV